MNGGLVTLHAGANPLETKKPLLHKTVINVLYKAKFYGKHESRQFLKEFLHILCKIAILKTSKLLKIQNYFYSDLYSIPNVCSNSNI